MARMAQMPSSFFYDGKKWHEWYKRQVASSMLDKNGTNGKINAVSETDKMVKKKKMATCADAVHDCDSASTDDYHSIHSRPCTHTG